MVNQTEYWLKYWYNDVSEEDEGDEGDEGEEADGDTYWTPPECFDNMMADMAVVDMDLLPAPNGIPIINVKNYKVLEKTPESNERRNDYSGALSRAMRNSISALVSPVTHKVPPIAEPEPEEQESFFDRINTRIRVSLETSYGHPVLGRQNSMDADEEDNCNEGRQIEMMLCSTVWISKSLTHACLLQIGTLVMAYLLSEYLVEKNSFFSCFIRRILYFVFVFLNYLLKF